MKFTEIKDLGLEELNKKEKELRDKLFQAKMKNTLGQLGSPIEIRGLRKDVARIQTALNAKRT